MSQRKAALVSVVIGLTGVCIGLLIAAAVKDNVLLSITGREPVEFVDVDPQAKMVCVGRFLSVSAINADRGSVGVYSAQGGRLSEVWSMPSKALTGGALVPNAGRVVIAERDTLRLIDYTTKRELWKTAERETLFRYVTVGPGQDVLAVCQIVGAGGFHVYSMSDGKRLGRYEHPGCTSVAVLKNGDLISAGGGTIRRWPKGRDAFDKEITLGPWQWHEAVYERPGGELVVAAGDGELFFLDPVRLDVRLKANVSRTWLLRPDDEKSVVVVAGQKAVRVSAETGKATADIEVAQPVVAAPAAVAPALLDGSVVLVHDRKARRGRWDVMAYPIPPTTP